MHFSIDSLPLPTPIAMVQTIRMENKALTSIPTKHPSPSGTTFEKRNAAVMIQFTP